MARSLFQFFTLQMILLCTHAETAELSEIYRADELGPAKSYSPSITAIDSNGVLLFTVASGAILELTPDGVLREVMPPIIVNGLVLEKINFLTLDENDNLFIGGALETTSSSEDTVLSFFKVSRSGVAHELTSLNIDSGDIDLQSITDGELDSEGNLFVSGYVSNNVIRIDVNGGVTEFLRGPSLLGDIPFDNPRDLLFDDRGVLYIAATGSDNVISVTPSGELAELINSQHSFNNSFFSTPYSLSINQYNEIFVTSIRADGGAFILYPDGEVSKAISAAGDGTGYVLDFGGGFTHSIPMHLGNALIGPRQSAVDSLGNFYVVGEGSNNVFRVSRNGTITAISETAEYSNAVLDRPLTLAIDQENSLYINSAGSNSIAKITQDVSNDASLSDCLKASSLASVTDSFNCFPNNSAYPIFRFYNSRDNAFFYTVSKTEAATIKSNSRSTVEENRWPYEYQGSTFGAAYQYSGSVPLYRFYNFQTGHHFFTASEEEREYVTRNIAERAWPFVFEGPAFQVYLQDPTPEFDGVELPVFRLYSPTMNRHFFTANPIEATLLSDSSNWIYEGIGFYGEAH